MSVSETGNKNCDSQGHCEHICYLVSQGFHLSDGDEFKALVSEAKYKCEHCGRVARSAKHLCEPVEL